MSKRSAGHASRPRDFWPTPRKAVLPLLPHLGPGTRFAEPCAGNGALIDLLEEAGHQCSWASDIAPQRVDILADDALELPGLIAIADCVITNPPWSRHILHPMIEHLSSMLPIWMLFDADWPFTKQSSCLIRKCSRIIPIGRVKWIPDSPHQGMDSCAWYEFLPGHTEGPRFIGYGMEARKPVSPALDEPRAVSVAPEVVL